MLLATQQVTERKEKKRRKMKIEMEMPVSVSDEISQLLFRTTMSNTSCNKYVSLCEYTGAYEHMYIHTVRSLKVYFNNIDVNTNIIMSISHY